MCKHAFFPWLQWNGTTTYHFEVERDFGTDYGVCCWYTPQFNFTYILENSRQQGQGEPDWGYWFTKIEKVKVFLFAFFPKVHFSRKSKWVEIHIQPHWHKTRISVHKLQSFQPQTQKCSHFFGGKIQIGTFIANYALVWFIWILPPKWTLTSFFLPFLH